MAAKTLNRSREQSPHRSEAAWNGSARRRSRCGRDPPVLSSLAITRELELVGSFRFNDEIDDVVAALADRSLFVDPVVTHPVTLDQALEATEVA